MKNLKYHEFEDEDKIPRMKPRKKKFRLHDEPRVSKNNKKRLK